MSTMRSQDEIRNTVVSLGLPEHPYFMRRAARAMDLLDTGKVNFVGDEMFRVHSQFDDQIYHVELNHGLPPRCDCADYKKNPGVSCKHIISSLLYARKQSQAITIVKTTDGEDGDYWRRCWLIAQGNRRTLVYEEPNGRLFCNCGAFYGDCEHKQLVIKTVKSQLRFINECGTEQAKALQDKMNAQLNKSGNNGNGAQAPSQPIKLDLRDPFQESEAYDIDQIEGRKNGELAWKLSNGGYCISYAGIMSLAQKHDITFSDGDNSQTKQVIARARLNGSERVSGKLPIPSRATAVELAKRNAARQLLPLEEIKAIEYKTKLNAEFDWNIAHKKCVELVGIEANVDIIIYELVRDGKLRQEHPANYDRTEWLIIHNACKQDASNDNNDGGANTPSSPQDDGSNWREWYNKCVKVSSLYDAGIVINQMTPKHYYRKDRITDDEWQRIFSECQRRREEYERTQAAKASFADLQQAYKFKHIRDISGYDVKSKQFVGRPPLNSKEFLERCKEAIEKVRDEKNTVEAVDIVGDKPTCHEQPLEGGNVKRQLQMDKKLRTWLVESDGTKKAISCREICEQFENKQNPSIVPRLRACIDDGADIGIVELDD